MSKSDDLISRQDALNALGEEPFVWNEHNDEWELGKNKQWHEDVEAIKSVPSVQPTPCEFCKHNDISDDVACLRCAAERRTDG